MSEWIKCSDRLPSFTQFLGYCFSEGMHVFKNDGDYCVTGGWEGCNYCGGQSMGVLPNQDEPKFHKKT